MSKLFLLSFCFFMVLRCFGATKDLEPFSPSLLKKAEAGDSEAQYLLGYNYLFGKGVAKNEQESIRWFILSAKKGHPKSMNSLGDFFLKNKIDSPETDAEIAKATPEISFSKAKKDLNQPHHLQMALFWFMQAADAGNPRAKTNIGSMYWNGIGLEQNPTEAVRWLEEAAADGCPAAQTRLSLALMGAKPVKFSGETGVEKNPQKALELMYMAASKNPEDEPERISIAYAQTWLATYYYYGAGGGKNLKESIKWTKKSAESGDPTSQYHLGIAYKNGDGVEKNTSEAIRWFKKSAEQTNASSLYELGLLYKNGVGIEQSYQKAIEYYVEAARWGHAKAQNNLGILYLKGEGIEKKPGEAFRLFLRSSLQTNVLAYGNLALCYKNGYGTETNLAEAIKWFDKGASAGDAFSQYNLARLYEQGVGLERNTSLAEKLYRSSAEQGYEPAKSALQK